MTVQIAVVGRGDDVVRVSRALVGDGRAVYVVAPLVEHFEEVRRRLGAPESQLQHLTELGSIPVGVQLVIEAVDGTLEDKKEVLSEAAAAIGDDVLLASANRIHSVTELSSAVGTPTRFSGLRFVEETSLVEVVTALATDDETSEQVRDILRGCGLQVVTVGDRPGFLVDALLLPYLNQAIDEYDGDIAGLDDIDLAVTLGLGYPSGPFEVLDRVGLDRHLEATAALYQRTGEHQYAPPPLLQRMVAAGWTGTGSNRGFRDDEGLQDD